jgi:hypothetical protein
MELVPSRGLTFAYSATIESQTLVGSGANSYYLPGEPADGTFVNFTCIKDVPNGGNVKAEFNDHRCLDAGEKFVAKNPTGFLMSDSTTIKLAFAKAIYNTLDGYVKTSTHLTWRLKYALSPLETVPSQWVRTGYIEEISDVVNSNGEEVDATFSIVWSSLPKFTAGS